MKFPRRQVLQLAGTAVAALAATRFAVAQGYPARPVRLIVPFGAGGPTDVFGRLAAQKLTDILGKQFFVENIVGASGNIGSARQGVAARRAHAAADPDEFRGQSGAAAQHAL
jgi:tripartite-type tricarboxylate transporter receptor subunit TctC